MNDVALRPNAISSALCALTNAATLSRARAIIASTSRDCLYGPPRCTLRVSRWSVTASSTVSGTCAPAPLSKKTNEPARSSAENFRRISSTGNERTALSCSRIGGFPRPRVGDGDCEEDGGQQHAGGSQGLDEKGRRDDCRVREDAQARRHATGRPPD